MPKFDAKLFFIVATTLLVFVILLLLFFAEAPEATREVLFTFVGIILGKWGTMVDFNFGSSAGSAKKTDTQADLLSVLTGTGDGGKATTTVTSKIEAATTSTTEKPKEKP